jgi:hypothetical protein
MRSKSADHLIMTSLKPVWFFLSIVHFLIILLFKTDFNGCENVLWEFRISQKFTYLDFNVIR